MRKLFTVVVLTLALAASGCGGSSDNGATDTGTTVDGGGSPCAAEGADCTANACCTGFECDATKKLCAKPVTAKGIIGAPCAANDACESGLCFTDGGRIAQGYCSAGCTADTECAIAGKVSCCNNGTCEIVGGAACGARGGLLGDNCMKGGSSDCAAGFMCVGARGPDGTFREEAVCSMKCVDSAECHVADKKSTECLSCFSGSYTEKLCQPDPNCRVLCAKDADCDAANGEQCGLEGIADANGNLVGLGWGCMKTCLQGNLKYGEPCTKGEECCSLFCAKGECAGACASDADCGADHSCEQYSFRIDANDNCKVADVRQCLLTKGSGTACEGQTECTVAGEYCTYTPDVNGEPTTRCFEAAADGLVGGDDCVTSTKECKGGFCSALGYCLDFCTTEADCPAIPPATHKTVCVKAQMTATTTKGICFVADGSQTPCVKEGDCTNGEVCNYAPSFDDEGRTICSTPGEGNKLPGEKCDADVDVCAGGLACIAAYGYCLGFCQADADCSAGTADLHFFCAVSGITDVNGVAKNICLPLSGSGKACTSNADCASTNEVCKQVSDTAGVCGTPTKDGDQPGSPIGGDCASCPDECDKTCTPKSCANDMCTRAGWCTGACAANADCGRADYVCLLFGAQGQCQGAMDVLTISCATDADCYNPAENFCVDPGNQLLHCGVKCTTGAADACPTGYECKEIMDGQTSKGFNCVLTI